jgi:hypothetical protein
MDLEDVVAVDVVQDVFVCIISRHNITFIA